jgi:four helix bundle protein
METRELAAMLNTYFNWNKCRMQRAASSIALNIAEGAGEYARHEKNRFYRMAKRSATECAAVLDFGLKLGLIDTKKLRDARDLLFRIVSMLIKMVSSSH